MSALMCAALFALDHGTDVDEDSDNVSAVYVNGHGGHVGHHVPDPGAVLVAVNVSALRADRAVFMTRLRTLTAPARSALSRIYVMADFNG